MKILFLNDSGLSDQGSKKAQRAIFDLIRATSKIAPEKIVSTCEGLDGLRGALTQVAKGENILVISPTIIAAPKKQSWLSRMGVCADDEQAKVPMRVDEAIAKEVRDRNLRILHVAEAKEVEGRNYQLRRLQPKMLFDEIPKLGAESVIAIDPDFASTPTCRAMEDFTAFIEGLITV